MIRKLPRVSIGLPVRNGHRHIRAAIESLLSQTFCDLELIVCDNASTDSTPELVRELCASDSRVRYFRNEENIGPAGNHNKCFALSRGEYFRWHGQDDLCAPTYLEKCVATLDADQGATIVYPRTRIIDDAGQPVEDYDFHPQTDHPSPSRRFGSLVLVNHRKHRAIELFGLMRSSALLQTPLEGAYARADSVLLARLALLGRFVELPERLFFSRTGRAQSAPAERTTNQSMPWRLLGTGPLPPPEWSDAARKGKVDFPGWNLFKQYWLSVGQAALPADERGRCYLVLLKWLPLNLPKLARDVLFAARHLTTSVMERAVGEEEPLGSIVK